MMLEEFLTTGKLGSLQLGLSRDEVRRLLGEPPDHSEPSRKREIWKYDSLQVAFEGDSLVFIGVYFDYGEAILPEVLVKAGTMKLEQDTVDDLEAFLREHNLSFFVEDTLTFDEYKVLRLTHSHVGLGFTDGHLRSAQLLSQT